MRSVLLRRMSSFGTCSCHARFWTGAFGFCPTQTKTRPNQSPSCPLRGWPQRADGERGACSCLALNFSLRRSVVGWACGLPRASLCALPWQQREGTHATIHSSIHTRTRFTFRPPHAHRLTDPAPTHASSNPFTAHHTSHTHDAHPQRSSHAVLQGPSPPRQEAGYVARQLHRC